MSTAKIISKRLLVERLPDGRRKLKRALEIDLGVDLGFTGKGVSVAAKPRRTIMKVPAGFVTDYSSIPWGLRNLMGRFDKHDLAGVFHDAWWKWGHPYGLGNRMWRIIARSGERCVNPIQGVLGWAGLWLGGWLSYRKHARARKR